MHSSRAARAADTVRLSLDALPPPLPFSVLCLRLQPPKIVPGFHQKPAVLFDEYWQYTLPYQQAFPGPGASSEPLLASIVSG